MGQGNVNTSNGLRLFRSIDLDETEEDVKTSECVVYWVRMHNNSAADRFVKFYNATAAVTSVGTTAPVLTIPMEASAGETWDIPHGLRFDTALCVAATTGVADSDTGAPGNNDIIINIGYA
jgi:hypothetical protein